MIEEGAVLTIVPEFYLKYRNNQHPNHSLTFTHKQGTLRHGIKPSDGATFNHSLSLENRYDS